MELIPKKSKVSVREISKKIAKEMIVKHHYSHAWTSCRYALGIFYETDNEHSFFDEKEEKFEEKGDSEDEGSESEPDENSQVVNVGIFNEENEFKTGEDGKRVYSNLDPKA